MMCTCADCISDLIVIIIYVCSIYMDYIWSITKQTFIFTDSVIKDLALSDEESDDEPVG